jgi:small-conductance mechanosensitive channel
MNMKVNLKMRNLFLAICIFSGLQLWAQNDSIEGVHKDSILNIQHDQGVALLSKADSAHIADSLKQQEILLEIANLRNQDAVKKQLLQARLDSMKLVQIEEDKRIKKQVDSLRASTAGVPVIFYKDTLFYIFAKLGPYSPSDRAKAISQKLEALVDENTYNEKLLKIKSNAESDDIVHDKTIILSITDRDAFWVDKSRNEVAKAYLNAIETAIAAYEKSHSLFSNIIRVVKLLFVLLLFFFGVRYMNRGFTWLNKKVLLFISPYLNGLKFKNYEFLSAEKEMNYIQVLVKVIKWTVIAFVVYLALPAIFSIFPATKGIATTLIGYVLNPIKDFSMAIITYIPSLITVIVILGIVHYFVRFLSLLSKEVENGKLQLPNFYPEWARPTFTLIRIIIYAFAFILIFPYLPGSDSSIFKGVSVFLGLLISLGSSSAISNIIAGLVITYMRAFKLGDRVKIGETVGDVIDKTMLVTHVRTIKNEDVTIPNSAILSGSTINYTTSAEQLGLILNSTVTIGYDVPWKKVHELLINAAIKTSFVNADPLPFVLQTSLDDFYVSYQINAYTKRADISSRIYSELHANIQDGFNEAGIEILSPHYRAARDGNSMGIPSEYWPKDYKSPGFNVNVNKDSGD